MKRTTIGFLSSMIPLIVIIIYSTYLGNHPLTEAVCILNNKSLGDYNCTGQATLPVLEGKYDCGPTKTYEFKYIATVKGSVEQKRVYGGKGQTCVCLLFDNLYAKINIPVGLYPVVGTDLEEYNKMHIGAEFTCYTYSTGEICKSNKGPTTSEIYTAISISSIILSVIFFVTIYPIFHKLRVEYASVNVIT